jgi:hypothetical protein
VRFCREVDQQRWDAEELRILSKVWDALVKNFFQSLIGENAKVLDIGGDFATFSTIYRLERKSEWMQTPMSAITPQVSSIVTMICRYRRYRVRFRLCIYQ